MIKIGDIVKNEYNNIGILTEINYPDEAVVKIFNSGIYDDTDYCSLEKCELASLEEANKIFKIKTS